ncbi:Zinc finger, RING-type [Sesbania bispinosa]|nr:Zinc finger, RING-type [Sesbania bispinosa]
MASSQIEIASSSPFGCVLIDHNRRDSAQNQNTKKPISNSSIWASRIAKNNLESLKLDKICRDNKDGSSSSLSALMSPRHSRIIDRWAARQAREVVTTLEKEVEVFENFPSRSCSFNSRREVSVSPPRSDDSSDSEISNLGASSLVQIWEKRLNKSNSTKPNALVSPGRTSLDNASCNENACSVEEHCRVSEEGESNDEPQCNEESSPDWEFDKTGPSDQSCSSKLQSSDAAERERGRVANIIKRLTVTNQMQSLVSSLNDDNDQEQCSGMTGSPHREHKAFGQVITCPRIRGRQAFNDLIMQFESDRHGELKNLAERGAVSKFNQRGRIQSLLRLRLLQRGVAVFDQSHQKSSVSEVNRQQQGSAIMQLRERFKIRNEHRTSTLAEVSDPRSPSREIVSSTSTTQMDNFPTSNQLSKDTHYRTVYCKEPTQNSVSQTSADDKEQAHPSSDATFQGTCFEAQNVDTKETIGASPSIAESNANETAEKVEAREQQYATAETSYDEIVEEEEASDQNYDEARYDWTSHISRPRSYWEELRQEWYREMLDFGSDNDERHHELGDYFNQSSPSMHTPSSTWSYRDNDAGDDSDRVASVSSPLPSQSQSFYQDRRQYSSSTNHHSIEMEFIYDMRGQMDQLFHEMSELRKSLKICMDMQMQSQQFKNQEVHTVKEERKKFHNKTPKKGNCWICHEKKVNSVLYRCGHMCACLKCANELQWNSGKCPICRAPIIDVVRVYTNTELLVVDRV